MAAMMSASKSFLQPSLLPSLPSPPPLFLHLPIIPSSLSFPLKPKPRFQLLANNNNNSNNNDNNLPQESTNGKNQEQNNGSSGNGSLFNNFKWAALLVDPDPDNVLAVGLAGLLTWASVQVLLQLFFISLAILVAALKYSFVAALLIFMLIALL